ncbi:hypothetical protein [Paraburkholderia sp. UCT70]|uniref:non-homologous end-joining DNA ligase LigD n=1 Tax=Paraburkholderia sp. UCT70 TaxID=2991068 RepID=UPI003D204218
MPDRFSATSGTSDRIGKIYVDYLRNGKGQTSRTAFTARARPAMGVIHADFTGVALHRRACARAGSSSRQCQTLLVNSLYSFSTGALKLCSPLPIYRASGRPKQDYRM